MQCKADLYFNIFQNARQCQLSVGLMNKIRHNPDYLNYLIYAYLTWSPNLTNTKSLNVLKCRTQINITLIQNNNYIFDDIILSPLQICENVKLYYIYIYKNYFEYAHTVQKCNINKFVGLKIYYICTCR